MEKWKPCVVPVILRERLTLPGPVSRKVTGFAPPPTVVKERTALFGLNGARSIRDLAPVKQGLRGSRRKGPGGGGAGACVEKSCGRPAAGRGRHTDNNTTPPGRSQAGGTGKSLFLAKALHRRGTQKRALAPGNGVLTMRVRCFPFIQALPRAVGSQPSATCH
ncbi:hypothetical protein VTI28DRAFT_3598 [Corynascus sepedonium]